MFVDRCKIEVYAGNGGNGCVSFRREKYVPRGGPDGGDGGDGGNIIAIADPAQSTLLDLKFHVVHRAGHGEHGRGKNQRGADGNNTTIRVPPGTTITDNETLHTIADLTAPGQHATLARGGKGGRGNTTFKSATNQTPREATPGETGEERKLICELKLIADIGLVGMPNAGKSTLLRAASNAQPKVAEYPFTTLVPHLGIAQLDIERRLVIADIPGLIEGAAQGQGLGHRFLRHVQRTRALIHVIDYEPADRSEPAQNYRIIRNELRSYAHALAEKPEIIALNKTDLLGGNNSGIEAARMLHHEITRPHHTHKPSPIVPISAATGEGVPQLLEAAYKLVKHAPAPAAPAAPEPP